MKTTKKATAPAADGLEEISLKLPLELANRVKELAKVDGKAPGDVLSLAFAQFCGEGEKVDPETRRILKEVEDRVINGPGTLALPLYPQLNADEMTCLAGIANDDEKSLDDVAAELIVSGINARGRTRNLELPSAIEGQARMRAAKLGLTFNEYVKRLCESDCERQHLDVPSGKGGE